MSTDALFTEAFPILVTPDLSRALGFYRDVCGATLSYQFPPDGDPDYVGLELGSSHIGIALDPAVAAGGPVAARPGSAAELCVYTADCDATVERLRAAGAPVIDEPADQPWGERMARVADPDGNQLLIMMKL